MSEEREILDQVRRAKVRVHQMRRGPHWEESPEIREMLRP